MSQGLYIVVEDKYGEGIEHVSISSCCTTGGNGTCWCDTTPGNHNVTASRYGYVSDSQSVYVTEDYWTNVRFTTATSHELHASIEGTVHDEDGAPLSNMMVWGQGILDTTKYWGCLTKSDGTYSLPINSAGDYMIRCGKNNYDIITGLANYSQASSMPSSTTIVNFTGNYKLIRSGASTDAKIAISGRAMMIKDNLDNGYHYSNITAQTDTVFTKTRRWTGSYLSTVKYNGDDEIRDGYGGSQYD